MKELEHLQKYPLEKLDGRILELLRDEVAKELAAHSVALVALESSDPTHESLPEWRADVSLRAAALSQIDNALQSRSKKIVKRCSCGKTYTRAQWISLPPKPAIIDAVSRSIILTRSCSCGSTGQICVIPRGSEGARS
jgi:hypothetical protein